MCTDQDDAMRDLHGLLRIQIRSYNRRLGTRRVACTLVDLSPPPQVSAVVPLLRFFNRRVVFYCHYPDKLLCVERGSAAKRMYRSVIDKVEEISLFFANEILVNSKYT